MMIKPATHGTHAVTALLIKHEISHEAKLTLANKPFYSILASTSISFAECFIP